MTISNQLTPITQHTLDDTSRPQATHRSQQVVLHLLCSVSWDLPPEKAKQNNPTNNKKTQKQNSNS